MPQVLQRDQEVAGEESTLKNAGLHDGLRAAIKEHVYGGQMTNYEWAEESLGPVKPEPADALAKKLIGHGLCMGCNHWEGCNVSDEDTPPSEVGLCVCTKLSPERKDTRGTSFPDGLLLDKGQWLFPGPKFGCVHWKAKKAQ